MRRRIITTSLAALTASGCGSAVAEPSFVAEPALPEPVRSEQAEFRVVTLVEGFENPWSSAFLPDGGMLVTERPGRLRLVEGAEVSAPIGGLPGNIAAQRQGGLLDVAVDPDFDDNRLIYLSYSGSGTGGRGTEVAKARLSNDGGRLENLEVIFAVDPKTPGSAHYGSRLLFDVEGALLATVGDRYSYMDEAQNPSNHLGSVVRIDSDDGSAAPGNPEVAPDAAPEVFTYGHRNPQGLALRPSTGEVWAHEHGPRGGDEVNTLKAGNNYGWPEITYGIDYSGAVISNRTEAPGMEQPVIYWDPSIAPSGMAFYDGDAFPEWQGDLFVGALAGSHLRRLELESDRVVNQEVLLEELGERVRDVRVGPDGLLYLLFDSADGRLVRLEPTEKG